MKKLFAPLSILAVILILVYLIVMVSFRDSDGNFKNLPTSISKEDVETTAQNMDAQLLKYDFMATLKDVTGGNSSGEALSGYVDDRYHLLVNFENLPELEGSDFYEGWVVRKSPSSVVSTGKVKVNSRGIDINQFIDVRDFSDHTSYVLTLEPDDGNPAPAAHILEGEFKAF